ncbi:conserved hypothetical protein [Talaromyces stipitatus ATCC 10500]|uniref:Uncharacterized protein n=1 Tax=Talaromyces stipitatus (strain ATCC 10500 / CBS 375.48 / QM 6759 / NRRL 1006) TaxID=441959 RepID=B8M822_TALSN|nr:uncharacterized protein TSTA_032400 [Talaromyces stipitatus ATCC 10500]EED19984.1 conserved hypothetical protein [Talaromyces stipitatus ATCC 10500]
MTTDHQDVYSSHAAFSILASTLLPRSQQPSTNRPSTQTSTWDLRSSIDEFFELSKYRNDRSKLFRCGVTIGLSWLRDWGDGNQQNRDSLVGLLLEQPSQNLDSEGKRQDENRIKTTRVFIIHPIQSIIFAPEILFRDLVGAQQALDHDGGSNDTISEEQAISLLDRVELLPVHDFSSATQAINQVSDAISTIRGQYRPTSTDEKEEETQPPETLLIIEGLDTMAEDVIHNSNAMRGSAILTPVLRTLTHLSRTHASFLSVLVVSTTPLGPSMLAQQHSQSQTQVSSTQQTSLGDGRTTTIAGGGLYSAFARDYTRFKSVDHGQTQQPLLNTLLSRTMDQGIDTHLLLQARRGQTLVEVIKDRTGDGLGKWCIWRS